MTPTIYPRGVRVHPKSVCAPEGYACPFHRPSEHHMRGWPMTIRLDKGALVERLCEHGCGHPDPDSLKHLVRVTGQTHYALHGCCGCCRKPVPV